MFAVYYKIRRNAYPALEIKNSKNTPENLNRNPCTSFYMARHTVTRNHTQIILGHKDPRTYTPILKKKRRITQKLVAPQHLFRFSLKESLVERESTNSGDNQSLAVWVEGINQNIEAMRRYRAWNPKQ